MGDAVTFATIWDAVAGQYPKQGTIVGNRRVIKIGAGTDIIVFTDNDTGAGAYFTRLSEWRDYEKQQPTP